MPRLTGDGAAEALQRLAREQRKTKLLADINADMMVCDIEGWDQTAYRAAERLGMTPAALSRALYRHGQPWLELAAAVARAQRVQRAER